MNKNFSATLLFSIVIVLLAFQADAEIYQWRDDNGKVNFSDKPRQGSKPLKLRPNGFSYNRVDKVYDGDTVLLDNGVKVRLLTINTPEIEHADRMAEPGGEQAKTWLAQQLKGVKVRLHKDVEKKDKYGRVLAHLFTEDKRHINLELVNEGYAFVNIHPPNLQYAEALLKAQQLAQQAQRGLWAYPRYRARDINQMNRENYKGWQRLVGRVKSLREARKFVYLELTENLDARIERKNLSLFPLLSQYIDKQVELRGWVSRRKDHYSILIRHPSAILYRDE